MEGDTHARPATKTAVYLEGSFSLKRIRLVCVPFSGRFFAPKCWARGSRGGELTMLCEEGKRPARSWSEALGTTAKAAGNFHWGRQRRGCFWLVAAVCLDSPRPRLCVASRPPPPTPVSRFRACFNGKRQAAEYVNSAFKPCYYDTEPYDKNPL